MVLGFVEDFTTETEILDEELKLNAKSGIALNSGVHPSITLNNLLQFLPLPEFKLNEYDAEVEYNNYSNSLSRKDVVSFNGKIYQCKVDGTTGMDPGDSSVWFETNRESLILKSFIQKVKDRILSDLKLSKRLINSQYLYNGGSHEVDLQGDYSAMVFEAKGSDYISFTINEISLQALTVFPVNMYVINQNQIVDTIVLHPENGSLKFEKINYSFSGFGSWVFAIQSQKVLSNYGWIDPLRYDGFICYAATGRGINPADCRWSESTSGNGLGFNISISLDSDKYVDFNFMNFTSYFKATFELIALQGFLHNSNNRSNRTTKEQLDKELLMYETKEMESNTVARRYFSTMKEAKRVIEKTFDTQLYLDGGIETETTSV
jgi:hypothetical protein